MPSLPRRLLGILGVLVAAVAAAGTCWCLFGANAWWLWCEPPTAGPDLYAVLGAPTDHRESIDSAGLRKLYRRLAVTFNPSGRMQSDNAAERYREIVEAYKVLSDAGTRQLYDEGGMAAVRAAAAGGGGAAAAPFDDFWATARASGRSQEAHSSVACGTVARAALDAAFSVGVGLVAGGAVLPAEALS